MNIRAAAEGQAFGGAPAIGSRTGCFRRESMGAAIFAVRCLTPIQTPDIPWHLTSKVFKGRALSS